MRSLKFFLIAFIAFPLCLSLGSQAFADENAEIIISEFNKLLDIVKNSQHDRMVGDLLKAKDFGNGVSLLWKIGETDKDSTTIRIRSKREGEKTFDISYHRSSMLVKGTIVIRRFIGFPQATWRSDTVDLNMSSYLSYLGVGGSQHLFLSEANINLLSTWGVTLLD